MAVYGYEGPIHSYDVSEAVHNALKLMPKAEESKESEVAVVMEVPGSRLLKVTCVRRQHRHRKSSHYAWEVREVADLDGAQGQQVYRLT